MPVPPSNHSADNTLLRPEFFTSVNGSRSSNDLSLNLRSGQLAVPDPERGRDPSVLSYPHQIQRASSRASRASSTHSRFTVSRPPSRQSRPRHINYGIFTPTDTTRNREKSNTPRSSVVNLSVHAPTNSSHASTQSIEHTVPPTMDTLTPPIERAMQPSMKRRDMFPILEVNRYGRDIKLRKRAADYSFEIPAMTFDFDYPTLDNGWEACIHPEGALYFFNEKRKIYTDAYLYDQETFDEIEDFASQMAELVESKGITLPEDIQLALELDPDETGENNWQYYFVRHSTRTLFWLHDFDVADLTDEIMGETSLQHIRYELHMKYWNHIENFSFGQQHFTSDIFEEVMNLLIHAIADQLTSLVSTVVFSLDDLHKLLNIVKQSRSQGVNAHSICIAGRVMAIFMHPRFINYYGQWGARLSRDQSIYYESSLPRPRFIEKLKTEWQDFTLVATVLLTANVSFLAIPSVDIGTQTRTAAQISSYVSSVASIGSILTSMLLIRQWRVKPKENVQEAHMYLQTHATTSRGIEGFAVLCSLPYAFLMWAMVSFLLAFCLECLMTQDLAAIATASIAWGILILVVLWCIYQAWESNHGSMWTRFLNFALERIAWAREHHDKAFQRIISISSRSRTTTELRV
ncbi:hypothetical protein ABKN59_004796 [Abortiporus biennis]